MVRLTLTLRPRSRTSTIVLSSHRIFKARANVNALCVARLQHVGKPVFLLLALSIICGGSSHASLRVRDDAPHAEQWFRLYNELPDIWKTQRTIKLRELPPRDMERLIAQLEGGETDEHGDSVVDGCYQNEDENEDTPVITLCDNLRGEQASLVFTHEYGHFVWDAILTGSERARYIRLWCTQKRAHHLVTEYACDSEEEGFAEAFAYFLRKPALLQKRDTASLRFFHDLLSSR